ncbi:MAG: hypothetical protein KDK07_22465 [Bauldia sp.]|nr:hypothetical protein [Bauldia sp.]
MAEKGETTAVRLIRFLALGVPTLSRVVAVVLVAAALALAFFDFGGYDEGERADFALLFSVLALVALAFGYAVPRLVARFLPRR